MSQAAGAMNHPTTIGDVRESYLTAFLRELLPQGVSATSGVLCDWAGRTSRQLDLVLTLDSSLPVLTMSDGIALVPLDSALLAIEIKSTLTSEALTQVENQNASITQLQISGEVQDGGIFILPTMVVAMEESDLSVGTVADWIAETGNTAACCVVGKYFVRDDKPKPIQVVSAGDNVFNETLAFVACLYHALLHLKDKRLYEPNWGRFLLT